MRSLILSLAAASVLAAQSQQLFNGKDMSGWTMVGPGRFLVENGMLKTEGGMGLLYYSGRKFGGETIRVVFKTATPKANSGVFIRLPDKPLDTWYGVHNGYEVQIDAAGDEWHSTGAIYSLSKANKRMQKATGEWNTMDIQLDGQTTRISVNGEVVNEFNGDQSVPERKQWYEPVRGPRPDQGYIGLQNHDPESTVYFKEISVLGKAAAAPAVKPISKGDRDRILSYYHSTRKQFLDNTAGLSDAQWNYKPGPDRWSAREIIEHLAMTESGLMGFALSGIRKPQPAPAEYKMTDEAFIARIKDRSQKAEAPPMLQPSGKLGAPAAIINEFRSQRDKNLDYLRDTEDDLRGSYLNGPAGPMPVYHMLLLIPAHVERHLAQFDEVKAAEGFPKK